MKKIKKYESAIRKVLNEVTEGKPYNVLKNLKEARKYKDSFLIMDGDYGGQIYLVVPVSKIKIDEEGLKELLKQIDVTEWNDIDGAGLYFERSTIGSKIIGGMGGAIAKNNLWVHKDLAKIKDKIKLILENKIKTIKLKKNEK